MAREVTPEELQMLDEMIKCHDLTRFKKIESLFQILLRTEQHLILHTYLPYYEWSL